MTFWFPSNHWHFAQRPLEFARLRNGFLSCELSSQPFFFKFRKAFARQSWVAKWVCMGFSKFTRDFARQNWFANFSQPLRNFRSPCETFTALAKLSQSYFWFVKFLQSAFDVAKFSQGGFGVMKFSHALRIALFFLLHKKFEKFFHLFWNSPAIDQKLN